MIEVAGNPCIISTANHHLAGGSPMFIKNSVRVTFLVLAVALISSAALSQTATKVPLTHEAMWMMKRIGAPIPSPDGKWVVFSLVEPAYDEKDQVSDLWIVPSDGSAKPRRLTFSKGGESGVAWSPDSRRIAFSARREGDEVGQVYVLDVVDGGEAVRITSLSTGARSPQWRPDGKAILFVSTVYPGAVDDDANKKIAAERKAQKYRVRVYETCSSRTRRRARRQRICLREVSLRWNADLQGVLVTRAKSSMRCGRLREMP
jgi:dipeptidyl aminopeptidase/acylaminoacyl peptidase